jgi:hypothetical protein
LGGKNLSATLLEKLTLCGKMLMMKLGYSSTTQNKMLKSPKGKSKISEIDESSNVKIESETGSVSILR